MKYENTIEIDLPLDKVIELFDNQDNMYHWMDGLEGHEHLSGTPGEPGAEMLLHFKMGKSSFSMKETITEKNLPHVFAGKYETKFATNHVSNSFEEAEGRTIMTSVTEVTAHSFIVRLMTWLLPASFRKQSQVYLENFKKFAENQ